MANSISQYKLTTAGFFYTTATQLYFQVLSKKLPWMELFRRQNVTVSQWMQERQLPMAVIPFSPRLILILSFESTTCHINETTIKEAMVQNMCFTKMCFYLPWGYNTTAKNTTRLVILARNTRAQRELNNRLAGPETLHLRVTVCR